MHFTLLVAGALLPGKLAVALAASLELPTLKARLARATRVDRTGPVSTGAGAHLDWLASQLFSHPPPVPTAPYAYAYLAGTAASTFVWHADPVHIEVARDHLIVQALGADAPTALESERLVASANEFVARSGCELVTVQQHWFLRCPHDWQLDTRPLMLVDQTEIEMPAGRDAQVWNRLHNEIQIAWHAHAVNAEREANGVRAINAIWLHGGGRWKPLASIRFGQVQSDAPEWMGAAIAAGSRGAASDADICDTALVVSEDALKSMQRQDWAAWLHAMAAIDRRLAGHAADSIDLILCGAGLRTYRSRLSDRYKVWRRRPLQEALAE